MNLYEAEKMARALIREHGLDYSFRFDRAVRRFGKCNTHKKIISLSKHLTELNDEAEVQDTIRHEIAHALAPGDGHNKRWKQIALRIGANGRRRFGETVIKPKPKYWAVCPGCQRQVPRYRKRIQACGLCCDRFNRGKFTTRFQLIFHRV